MAGAGALAGAASSAAAGSAASACVAVRCTRVPSRRQQHGPRVHGLNGCLVTVTTNGSGSTGRSCCAHRGDTGGCCYCCCCCVRAPIAVLKPRGLSVRAGLGNSDGSDLRGVATGMVAVVCVRVCILIRGREGLGVVVCGLRG